MIPEDPNNEWFKLGAYAALAAVGGMLGSVMRTIDDRKKITWWIVFAQGAAAAFVGCLTYFLCVALELSQAWTGITVGVLGWLGANATIGVLSKIVFNKLGITVQSEPLKERENDV